MPDPAFRNLKLRPGCLTCTTDPNHRVAGWGWSGTSGNNVLYNTCEQMLNELAKCNKSFQLMRYASCTRGISEGKGTSRHPYQVSERKLFPPSGTR